MVNCRGAPPSFFITVAIGGGCTPLNSPSSSSASQTGSQMWPIHCPLPLSRPPRRHSPRARLQALRAHRARRRPTVHARTARCQSRSRWIRRIRRIRPRRALAESARVSVEGAGTGEHHTWAARQRENRPLAAVWRRVADWRLLGRWSRQALRADIPGGSSTGACLSRGGAQLLGGVLVLVRLVRTSTALGEPVREI